MDQLILACDNKGKFLEYIPKMVGHTGEGRRHLAITVLVYNQKGEVLLQKRKHQIFDKVWDFTASTHPLHREDGTDETLEQATLRALKDEYDIQNISLKKVGGFNYFAQIGKHCENEHCFLLIGQYDGGVRMNPTIGYEYKWMNKNEFAKDVKKNPQKYAPWVVEGMTVLKKSGFFD